MASILFLSLRHLRHLHTTIVTTRLIIIFAEVTASPWKANTPFCPLRLRCCPTTMVVIMVAVKYQGKPSTPTMLKFSLLHPFPRTTAIITSITITTVEGQACE